MNASISKNSAHTTLSKLDVFDIFNLSPLSEIGPFIKLNPWATRIPYTYVYVNDKGQVYGTDEDLDVAPLGTLHITL